jgi:hypothetical protein
MKQNWSDRREACQDAERDSDAEAGGPAALRCAQGGRRPKEKRQVADGIEYRPQDDDLGREKPIVVKHVAPPFLLACSERLDDRVRWSFVLPLPHPLAVVLPASRLVNTAIAARANNVATATSAMEAR